MDCSAVLYDVALNTAGNAVPYADGASFLGGQYKLRQAIIALPCVCTAHCSKIVLVIIETSFGTFVIPKEVFNYACAIRSAFFIKIIKERGLLAPLSLVEVFIFSASDYPAFVSGAICLPGQYGQFLDDLFAPRECRPRYMCRNSGYLCRV